MLPVDTWCFSRIHTTFGRRRRKYCTFLQAADYGAKDRVGDLLVCFANHLLLADHCASKTGHTTAKTCASCSSHSFWIHASFNFMCHNSLKIQFLQSGAFRVAKHGGAYISFISWSIYRISDPAPCEVYKLVLQMFQKLCWKVIFPERRKEFPR